MPQGTTLEIAVSAVSHTVIEEIRQVSKGAIECYRQFSRGIVITEYDIGNGITTPLPWVPSLHDGITSFRFRNESDGRARAIDIDYPLASLADSGNKTALTLRQLYVRTVTSLEAVCVNLHLFSLKRRGDTSNKDYHVGIANLRNDASNIDRLFFVYVKLKMCHARQLQVVYLYVILFPFLHLQRPAEFLHSMRLTEPVLKSISIDNKPVAVVCLGDEVNLSILLRNIRSLQPCGKVLQFNACSKDRVASIIQFYGIDIRCSSGCLPLHLRIVPERSRDSLPSIRRTEVREMTSA